MIFSIQIYIVFLHSTLCLIRDGGHLGFQINPKRNNTWQGPFKEIPEKLQVNQNY